MNAHGSNQNFSWQSHEIIIYPPANNPGPFHQTGCFCQQAGISYRFQAFFRSPVAQLCFNFCGAPFMIDQHIAFFHIRQIAVKIRQRDHFRGVKGMGLCLLAKGNMHIPAKVNLPLYRLAIYQQIDLSQWPHPAHPAARPSLALWPGEFRQ